MVEKTLKTTDGKLLIKIPSLLSEVTLGQLMEMQDKSKLNDLEAISILSGIAVQQLQQVINADDLQVFAEAVLSLSGQVSYLYNSDIIPQKITFHLDTGDKLVNVMQNLAIEPAGAFFEAREIIAAEINNHISKYGKDDWQAHFNPSLKACCQALAHYFYCRATGKQYDEYKAEEFCTEIKKLRVTEALPIAKHFFSCYPSLSKPKTNCFIRLRQHWKKRRGYKLLKDSSTSIP